MFFASHGSAISINAQRPKPPVSSRRTKLETWARSDLADRFRERLLAIDGAVAATWGKLAGEAEARGEPLPVIDGLISSYFKHLQHLVAVVVDDLHGDPA